MRQDRPTGGLPPRRWGPFYCHRRPDRSFFWRGKQFPVCARCTGLLVGYASIPLFFLHVIRLDLWWSLALLLPMLIDGGTQAKGYRESNNALRFITGLLFGVGQVGLASVTGRLIRSLVMHPGIVLQ